MLIKESEYAIFLNYNIILLNIPFNQVYHDIFGDIIITYQQHSRSYYFIKGSYYQLIGG